jgi:glycosyltransferase involved in cell wall biosynthesis
VKSKKIAFVVKNPKNQYSGGRIHALVIAKALAELNHRVDYYTNVKPIFFNDIITNSSSNRINVILNKLFLFIPQNKNYDLIIIIPHLASKKSFIFDRFIFNPFIKFLIKKNKSKTWFIDFESPNWINKVLPNVRPYSSYRYSNKLIKYVNTIISTTKIGKSYSMKYYNQLNQNIKYKQLYLAINNEIANKFENSLKENKVIYFGRFFEKHKNSKAIINIISAIPKNFSLIIIGNKSSVEENLLLHMETVAKKSSVKILFFQNINDKQKFSLISSSKVLFFSSKFEGYGLPPIEAQFVNTPVICSDIPVLREVNPKAVFDSFENISVLQKKIKLILEKKWTKNELKNSVFPFGSYSYFCENLKKTIATEFE